MHDIKAFQRNRNEAIQTLTAAFLIHFWFKGPSKLFGSFKPDNLVAGLSSDKQLVYLNFFLHDWSILPRYQVHLQFAITGQLSKLTRHQYKLSAITFFFFFWHEVVWVSLLTFLFLPWLCPQCCHCILNKVKAHTGLRLWSFFKLNWLSINLPRN